MTEDISIDLDVVFSNIKLMVDGLAEFPDDDKITRVDGADAPEAAKYNKLLRDAFTILSQDVDDLRSEILSTKDAILATAADMAKADESIADDVRALHEAFGGLTAVDAPVAGAPVAANVLPVLPSATKGTVQ